MAEPLYLDVWPMSTRDFSTPSFIHIYWIFFFPPVWLKLWSQLQIEWWLVVSVHKRSEPNASSTPSARECNSCYDTNSMHRVMLSTVDQLTPLLCSRHLPRLSVFFLRERVRGTVALQISNIRWCRSSEGNNSQSHVDTYPSSQHAKTTAWYGTRTFGRAIPNCWACSLRSL